MIRIWTDGEAKPVPSIISSTIPGSSGQLGQVVGAEGLDQRAIFLGVPGAGSVALAVDAVVELDHDRAQAGAAFADAADRGVDLVGAAHGLGAEWVRDALVGEELPPAGLGSVGVEAPVRAVDQDAERQRDVALDLRRVVGGDEGVIRVADRRPGRVDEVGAVEQLRGQRPRRAVLGAEQRQPLARRRAPRTRHEPEPVVEELLGHGQRGQRDHVQVGAAKQQEVEEALLKRGEDPGVPIEDVLLDVERGDHDDRSLGPRVEAVVAEPSEPSLQLGEAGVRGTGGGSHGGRHYRWSDPRPGHLQFGATWPRSSTSGCPSR